MPYYPHHSKNRWPVSDGKNKTCRSCLVRKEVQEFWKNNKNSDALQSVCKDCSKSRVYTYRNGDKGKVSVVRSRLKNVLASYRIDESVFNEMLASQNYVCAICQRPERTCDKNGVARRLAVDHCHKTGVVRGLLCSACNQALGKFSDAIPVLNRAINYLARHQAG